MSLEIFLESPLTNKPISSRDSEKNISSGVTPADDIAAMYEAAVGRDASNFLFRSPIFVDGIINLITYMDIPANIAKIGMKVNGKSIPRAFNSTFRRVNRNIVPIDPITA
jgi:hypothetical protein